MNKPIHCVEYDPEMNLIGKQVLCAQHEQGLGYYGILIGICSKTGKFLVQKDYDKNPTKWQWIIEWK